MDANTHPQIHGHGGKFHLHGGKLQTMEGDADFNRPAAGICSDEFRGLVFNHNSKIENVIQLNRLYP